MVYLNKYMSVLGFIFLIQYCFTNVEAVRQGDARKPSIEKIRRQQDTEKTRYVVDTIRAQRDRVVVGRAQDLARKRAEAAKARAYSKDVLDRKKERQAEDARMKRDRVAKARVSEERRHILWKSPDAAELRHCERMRQGRELAAKRPVIAVQFVTQEAKDIDCISVLSYFPTEDEFPTEDAAGCTQSSEEDNPDTEEKYLLEDASQFQVVVCCNGTTPEEHMDTPTSGKVGKHRLRWAQVMPSESERKWLLSLLAKQVDTQPTI